MADINETITTLTMEYLKPEYPIYKIEVIKSGLDYEEGEGVLINTKKKTIILEVGCKFYNNWKDYCGRHINLTDKRCSGKVIQQIIDCYENNEPFYLCCGKISWFILSCKRIA